MTDIEIIRELEKEYGKNVSFSFENDSDIDLSWYSDKKIPENIVSVQNIKKFYYQNIDGKLSNIQAIKKLNYIEEIQLMFVLIDFEELAVFIKEFNKLKKLEIYRGNFRDKVLSISLLTELSRLKLSINDLEDENGFKCDNLEFPPKILTDIGFNQPELYVKFYDLYINKLNEIRDYNPSQKIVESFIENKNILKTNNRILPKCVRQIYIKDFHDIKKVHITEIPENTQWIFLTGENGYGKSSILQAITIALFGKNEDEGRVLDKSKSLKTFVTLKGEKNGYLSNIINTTNGHFNGYIPDEISFASYGAVRVNKSSDRRSKTYNLFHSDGTLLDIESKFREWYNTEFLHGVYEKVKKVFLNLLDPYIDDIKVEIDREKSSKTLKYHERDSKEDTWLVYDELASGYKSIIATFGDMIIRLTEANKSSNIENLAGIVLIDEFDLHLHPRWQKELVEKLTKVFPKVQFIVSTHSPIPILGAPENSIIINVDRDKENGITAKVLDVDFKNLTPNSILTSPIFNFRSIIPNSNKDLEDLVTDDDYNEALFQKIVKQKLDDFVAEDETEYKIDNE